MSVNHRAIRYRLNQSGIEATTMMRGKTVNHLYTEAEVRKVCEDFFIMLPQADARGFVEMNGMRYASSDTWARVIKREVGRPIKAQTIADRLKKARIEGITARDAKKQLRKNAYFSETDARSVCADLLKTSDGVYDLKR